jgi:predicted DNA-binding transcriptional regulator AlpA
MPNPLVLDRAGLRRCGIRVANSTLLRWEAAGEFPRRFRLGQSVFWSLPAVEAHLARRSEEAGR